MVVIFRGLVVVANAGFVAASLSLLTWGDRFDGPTTWPLFVIVVFLTAVAFTGMVTVVRHALGRVTLGGLAALNLAALLLASYVHLRDVLPWAVSAVAIVLHAMLLRRAPAARPNGVRFPGETRPAGGTVNRTAFNLPG